MRKLRVHSQYKMSCKGAQIFVHNSLNRSSFIYIFSTIIEFPSQGDAAEFEGFLNSTPKTAVGRKGLNSRKKQKLAKSNTGYF